MPIIIEHIEITGIVQGVGFRPFVHNLAVKHGLTGYVLNSPDGVIIEAEGENTAVERFVSGLKSSAPPLSKIIGLERRTIAKNSGRKKKYETFGIRESLRGGKPVTLISPDVCVCDDCLREMFGKNDRRYLYPFINCTNCGPRFTIIRGLPYDRPFTTMSAFKMCPDCLTEYENPVDRRFHAQPNACPVCGPRLELLDSSGAQIPGDPATEAIKLLKNGGVLALKGLGGFHLAVDAVNGDAVNLLRFRKHREEKPLAIMTGSLSSAEKLIQIGESERIVLESRERPILLAPAKKDASVSQEVAPGNEFLGVMLPYTPLHYLLFFHPEAGGNYDTDRAVFDALVMTSGNISEEPICRDNDEALSRLSGIADAFLMHNRGIHVRCDDSVVGVYSGASAFMRRSRGYVPAPVFFPEKAPSVLALGGELKNTVCITEGRKAFLSQHIGDLENIVTLDYFHEAITHFKKILEIEPVVYAYDLHPEYLSTKYFLKTAEELPENSYGAVGVQHHHAHIAGVLAENGYNETVIGFSADGTGYGLDGAVWGGEILLCNPYDFVRVARLDYVPLPGGPKAVKEPWRMAFAYLRGAFGKDFRKLDIPCLKQVSPIESDVLEKALETKLNSPFTSSLGRLFDAVSSILDIHHFSAYEGQAAFMLEMSATKNMSGSPFPFELIETKPEYYPSYPELSGNLKGRDLSSKRPKIGTGYIIDFRKSVRALTEDFLNGKPVEELAFRFHLTVMEAFLETARLIRKETGINTVALSGGCWQNHILAGHFTKMLISDSFEALTNIHVPVNDGGLSLGQAYIAASIANLR